MGRLLRRLDRLLKAATLGCLLWQRDPQQLRAHALYEESSADSPSSPFAAKISGDGGPVDIDPAAGPPPPARTPVVVGNESDVLAIKLPRPQKVSYLTSDRARPAAPVRRGGAPPGPPDHAGAAAHLARRSGEDITYEQRDGAAAGNDLMFLDAFQIWVHASSGVRRKFMNLETMSAGVGVVNAAYDLQLPSLLNLQGETTAATYLTTAGLPLAILVGLLLLTAFLSLIALPWLCYGLCVRWCLRGRYAYPPRTRQATGTALAVFSVLLIFVALMNVGGSAQITFGLNRVYATANALMDDLMSKTESVPASLTSLIALAGSMVNSTIDQVAQIDFGGLDSLIGDDVAKMAANMMALQTALAELKVNGRSIVQAVGTLGNQITALNTSLGITLLAVEGLNDRLSTSANDEYQIREAISVPSEETGIDASSLPDLNQTLSPLDSVPDLSILASSLTAQYAALPTTFQSAVDSIVSSFKNDIASTLSEVSRSVGDTVSSQISSEAGNVYQAKTDSVDRYWPSVEMYDRSRHYGFLAVSGIVALAILCIAICIPAKRKRLVCCCGVFTVPFISLLAYVGLALSALSLPLGSICDALVDKDYTSFGAILEPDTAGQVANGFLLLDGCRAETSSLLDIAKKFGMDVNVPQMISGFADQLDIRSFLSGISFSSALDSLADLNVTSSASGFQEVTIDVSGLSAANTSAVEKQTGDLTTRLQTLDQNLDASMFQTFTASPNFTAILADYHSRINSTMGSIAAFNNSCKVVQQTLGSVQTAVTLLASAVYDAQSLVDGIASAFSNVTSGAATFLNETQTELVTVKADQIASAIASFSVSAESAVMDLSNCKVIATDIKAMINYGCISTAGGVDATWFSVVLLSPLLIGWAIAACCAANRLADPSAREGDKFEEWGDLDKLLSKRKANAAGASSKPFAKVDAITRTVVKSAKADASELASGTSTVRAKQEPKVAAAPEKKDAAGGNPPATAKQEPKRQMPEISSENAKAAVASAAAVPASPRREPTISPDVNAPAAYRRSIASASRNSGGQSVLRRPSSLKVATPATNGSTSPKSPAPPYSPLPNSPSYRTQMTTALPQNAGSVRVVNTSRISAQRKAEAVAANLAELENVEASLSLLAGDMAEPQHVRGSSVTSADSNFSSSAPPLF